MTKPSLGIWCRQGHQHVQDILASGGHIDEARTLRDLEAVEIASYDDVRRRVSGEVSLNR